MGIPHRLHNRGKIPTPLILNLDSLNGFQIVHIHFLGGTCTSVNLKCQEDVCIRFYKRIYNIVKGKFLESKEGEGVGGGGRRTATRRLKLASLRGRVYSVNWYWYGDRVERGSESTVWRVDVVEFRRSRSSNPFNPFTGKLLARDKTSS